ncbi:MAG: ribosome maturation factor RimM [Gammaproteobacteria bacterium]
MVAGDHRVILGRISGLFGVKGWVRLISHTDPREAILDYARWLIGRDADWHEFQLAEGRRHGKAVIARLEGFVDRDQAGGLIGADIAIERHQLPAAEKDEYYWADLVGLEVVTTDGRALGQVDHLLATGANDVLVVRGENECLVPFICERVIQEVDLDAGVIRVDWDPDF